MSDWEEWLVEWKAWMSFVGGAEVEVEVEDSGEDSGSGGVEDIIWGENRDLG